MKQFALPDWTSVFIESANPRPEKHGTEDVIAISLNLRLSDSNDILDLVSDDLREGCFDRDDNEPIPGMNDRRVNLRSVDLDGVMLPMKRVAPLEGATVFFDYGADGEENPITLTKSKVDKFSAVLHKGGTGDVFLRVGSNDISPDEIGALCSKMRQWIRIRVEPAIESEKPTTDAASNPNQPTLDGVTGSELREPSDARQAAEDAFSGDATDAVLDDVAKHGASHTATPIKYQDASKPSRVWTGLGKMPPWLKQALALGKTLADFEVAAVS